MIKHFVDHATILIRATPTLLFLRVAVFIYPLPSHALASADLLLLVTSSPNPVIAGENLTYKLSVSNNGPDAATGVILTDIIPSGVNVVSIPPSCSGTSTVTCNLGTLASGANTAVDIVVKPTVAGTITYTASVRGNEGVGRCVKLYWQKGVMLRGECSKKSP